MGEQGGGGLWKNSISVQEETFLEPLSLPAPSDRARAVSRRIVAFGKPFSNLRAGF